MNSVSSCGLFWAKQPLALFALLIIPDGQTGCRLTPHGKTSLTSSTCFLGISPQSWGANTTAPWKCAGNGERFLFVLLSYSICLRTGSFGLVSQYQAPAHDCWLWMRHILLQVFLERDGDFHLGGRKSQASTPTRETPFYTLGKFKMFAHSLRACLYYAASPSCLPHGPNGLTGVPGDSTALLGHI